jgi:AraC-like DNA-binding protein
MGALYANSTVATDKHHFWERTIDQAFGAVDMKIANEENFFGEMFSAPFGPLHLTKVVCDYEIATRTRRHIAHDKMESFVLVLLRSGRLQIGQLDRECILTPGMFVLFDLNAPYTFRHVERTAVLDLTIPTAILDARLRDPHRLVARPCAATSGVGRVTADVLLSLAREVERFPDVIAHSYCGCVVDLIGVMFESAQDELPIANSAVRSALYKRCEAIIDMLLGDPTLDPAKIAAAAGISVRYLHKIFQDAGESVGSYVRNRRLARCHRDLGDPAKRLLPISEIAFRAGFYNQSHFANRFKRRYGVSPSDLRRASAAGRSASAS